MYKIITVVLLLTWNHIHAGEVELIYKPKVLSPEIDNALDVEEYKWQLGLFAGQSMVENQDHAFSYGISANYLIWQQWYAAGRLSQKELQKTGGIKESAIAWSLGAGYNVLEGAAYITDGVTLPWQMYTEVMVGEQSLDGKSASYVDGAIGWQLNKDNNYAAIEWRYFSVDDKRLQQISSDKGYQWSLEFGRYF
jgi:hypothetical protein